MSDVAGFSVRPVEAADREQWSELYRGYRAFYQEADDDTKVATTWGFLMDPANESNGIVAVDDSGALIGMAVWREFSRPLEADRGIYLDDLFVASSARGRGAGEQLIRWLADLARERGFSVVRWITAEDNATARRLYDRLAEFGPWVTYDLEV
ncbi:MAG TPA: GNAT family N-acetyltransferase [Terrimesophilobacter sp.]|jgi:Sortase and related acyltransferases|uniref:GNAT family N-acetyltransferase n=1 Tax=Terrimesophilobacter sp. TaxID=2906435 RepID=UPI002F95C046